MCGLHGMFRLLEALVEHHFQAFQESADSLIDESTSPIYFLFIHTVNKILSIAIYLIEIDKSVGALFENNRVTYLCLNL